MRASLISLIFIFTTTAASAGIMELSASYGVRNSSIDENNYTKNESWTGSFAWYFLEMSAIELSYTKGVAEQSLQAALEVNPTMYFANFEMYGADLIITLAKKSSFLQPYVRGGMARLKKKFYKQDPISGAIELYGTPVDETVPSYGFGLKINLTQTFSLKVSFDRWRSGSVNDKDTWDDAIKAGLSWYF